VTTARDKEELAGGMRMSLTKPFFSVILFAVLGSTLLSFTTVSWAPALWASGCMLAYLWLTWRIAPAQLSTENYADNFYYLGFLLTLAALVIVLVQLGDPSELEGGLFKTVLSQFGLALITTLVGLAGRTVLMMERVGEEEIADLARARLEEAFEHLTRSLDDITATAEAFSGRFEKTLDGSLEVIDDSIRRFKKIIDQAADQMVPAQTRLLQLVGAAGDSVDGIRASANTLSAGLSTALSKIEDATDRIDEQTRETLRRVGNLADSSAQLMVGIRSQFERTFQELQASISAFGQELAGVATPLEALPGKLERIAAQADEDIGQTQESLQEFYRQIDAFLPVLRSVSTSLAIEGEAVKASLVSWRKNAEALGEIQARIISDSEGITRTIQQVRDEVAAGVQFLVDNLKDGGRGSGE
jgi:archaellum component FlaC